MTTLPDSLVTEMANGRCVPLVGAGFSRQAKSDSGESPPSWEGLLEACSKLAPPDDLATAMQLIEQHKYLDAAEIMLSERDNSTFGIVLAKELEDPKFLPSDAHRHLLAVQPKIIITTNYDNLIEQTASAEGITDLRVLRQYDDNVIDVIRSRYPLLYKVHGCITKPSSVVLTRSDYFASKQRYPVSFRVLDSIFVTNTVLFLGCSLEDPDIQLVLENVTINAPSSHPHYALMPAGIPLALQRAIRKAYNIQIISYDNSDSSHAEVPRILKQFADDVQNARGG